MIPTYGLTHISLVVRDLERTLHFYEKVFGMAVVFRQPGVIQAQTPGSRDIVAFEEDPNYEGRVGGLKHFGFRLLNPGDMEQAVREAVHCGGKLLRQGEFAPGVPYAYLADPDGYEIEIWYE